MKKLYMGGKEGGALENFGNGYKQFLKGVCMGCVVLQFKEKEIGIEVEKIKDSDFELEKSKSDVMQKCCKQLNEWGVHYLVKSQFHVRIGSVNFYPTKGTIYVDGCVAKYKKKGLDFLKEVLKKEGYLK